MRREPADVARIAAWAQHEFADEAFHQVLDVLERSGVAVLPVKGIVLAHTVYDTAEDRPMGDVDLRVRPTDLRRAAHALRAQGWTVRRTSRQLGALELFVSRTLVEIESTVGPPGVCAIPVDRMIARAGWHVGSRGRRHRVPEVHDHALHLCVNAFKDKLVLGHRWLRQDLLRIARLPAFSTDTMVARAGEARLATLVWIVAEWLAHEPGSAPWKEIGRALASSRRRRYARLYSALVERAPGSPVLAVIARAASDSALRRSEALGLGLAGTILQVVRQAMAELM